MRFVILLCVSQIFVMCCGVDVHCEFRFENWAVIGTRVYECKIHDLVINSRNSKCENVTGDHLEENKPRNVRALHIFGQKVSYIPDNISKFFGNLEGLLIAFCGLKKISSTDLQQFPRLQIILMPNNNIEALEKDLFKFNTQMKAIVLNHNKIKHIAHGIFTPLRSLSKVFLYKNSCIDSVAVNSIQIDELVSEMIGSCPPEKIKTHQLPVKTETQLKFEEIEGKMLDLEKKMLKKFDILLQQMKNIEKLLTTRDDQNNNADPLILSTIYS